MPKLYVDEYTRLYAHKSVLIACREGILRDHFNSIIADLKFLTRLGIQVTLFHNMSNRFANQKHFNLLTSKLPQTRIIRVPSETDFYEYVLDYQEHAFKLIFLERKYLVDLQGARINALTTKGARQSMTDFAAMIANENFKNILERICHKIEKGNYERVHILPAGKNAVKHELFTVEGSGTLIANNFTEIFARLSSSDDVKIVAGILSISKGEGYLKPRTPSYIEQNRRNFYVTKIDDIIVGCVEGIHIDPQTVELGALAISTKFRNQRVGVFTVNAFMAEMREAGYECFISLTNNPRLQRLYHNLGFTRNVPPRYRSRQEASPGVAMFFQKVAR